MQTAPVASHAIDVRTITPSDAAAMLSRNSRNRSLRPLYAAALARDMVAGRWVFTGDPIRLFEDGEVADGQHRLRAVVMCGIPQTFAVVSGVSEDAMQAIDSGRKRSGSDRLALAGVKNAKRIAPTLNLMAVLAQGAYSASLTGPEMFAAMAMHPDVTASVEATHNVGLGCENIIAALHYAGTFAGHEAQADAMLSVFSAQANPTSPFHVARERIIKLRDGRRRQHRDEMVAIICSAFAAAVAGREVSRLQPGPYRRSPGIHGWRAHHMPQGKAQ